MSFRSKLYSYEWVKSTKNGIRPLKHGLFGKTGIYVAMDEVARFAGGAENVKTIFDVGAATGEYALHFLKKFPNATIYCFEPLPSQFEELHRRTERFRNRVHVFNFGLYNHEGAVTFYEAPYKDASSLIEGRGTPTSAMMRRLDEVIKELPVDHIDFMKIDVEGVEREVIEGGMKTFGDMVDNAFIEIQPSFKNYNGDHIAVFEHLEHLGLKFVGCLEDYFFSKKVGGVEALGATQTELTHADHAAKYDLASKFCEGKVVLDCACGGGFGSDILSRIAKKVYGVDNDAKVLADAKHFYPASNIEFIVGDARKLSLPDNSVDVAVSVETLEHFVEQDEFMAELKRVVRPGGTIMITTPDHAVNMKIGVYNSKHRHGHGHPAELTFPQFDTIVRKYFSSPEYFGQYFMVGTPGLKHRVANLAKRLDVFQLRRKLLPKRTLDRLNAPARLTDFSSVAIKPLTGPAADMIVVCKNNK